MCGRFTYRYNWRQLCKLLGITTPPTEWPPRYNVAPSQLGPVVRMVDGGGRELAMLRWGLVPSWADDLKFGFRTINARAEGIATAPAFRSAIKRRRCIVPVSGYYEWQKIDAKTKQPFYLTAADDQPLMLAGLWESWRPQGAGADATVESFTIITTTPNEAAAKFHDRMPVILDAADIAGWLDPAAEVGVVLPLLKPSPAELLMAVPVSTVVNNPKNNTPDCIQPVSLQGNTPKPEQGELFGWSVSDRYLPYTDHVPIARSSQPA